MMQDEKLLLMAASDVFDKGKKADKLRYWKRIGSLVYGNDLKDMMFDFEGDNEEVKVFLKDGTLHFLHFDPESHIHFVMDMQKEEELFQGFLDEMIGFNWRANV
jgi:hypothetical protein